MAKIISASFVLVLVVVTLVMMNIYGVVEGKDEYEPPVINDCGLLHDMCFYVDPKYCPRYYKFCTPPQSLP